MIMNEITLQKVCFSECEELHKMQVTAFEDLLERYKDFDTNPACESIETIRRKFNQSITTYYFIMKENLKIGAVRIVSAGNDTLRISPIFILPQFQNKGYAQLAMNKIEQKYPNIKCYLLDTIKQEKKLCYLYEKLGYVRTGREQNIKPDMTIAFYEKKLS